MQETSTGLKPNIAALLAYLFTWVSGLIFILLEKKNNFVRFHAMQSIIFWVACIIYSCIVFWIPFVGWILALLPLVVWIILMVKAFNGEKFKLPLIGNWAEKAETSVS